METDLKFNLIYHYFDESNDFRYCVGHIDKARFFQCHDQQFGTKLSQGVFMEYIEISHEYVLIDSNGNLNFVSKLNDQAIKITVYDLPE